MRKKIKPQTISAISITVAVMSLFFAYSVWAETGTTDSSNPPDTTYSYTLDDIYHSLYDGTAGTASTFTEPSVAPGTGTMHTLNDIYDLTRERAPVRKTGQISSYATGDDGDLERGVTWPTTRFTDNSDGTVTDNLTKLIWLKNANCWGQETWADALSYANGLANGECGLTDGSSPGDWRLPSATEMLSLIDFGETGPPIPDSHLFTNFQAFDYWTSTSVEGWTNRAWIIGFTNGSLYYVYKTSDLVYLLPVRGGH